MLRELIPALRNASDRARRLVVCGVIRQHWFTFDDMPDIARALRAMVEAAERGERVDVKTRYKIGNLAREASIVGLRQLALYDADALMWMDSLGAAQHVLTEPRCVEDDVASTIVEDVATRREHSPPRDRNAVALAKELDATYTGTGYDAALIGVLGDALEDAGADVRVVRHVREHPFHVRGCWAVDALLAMC